MWKGNSSKCAARTVLRHIAAEVYLRGRVNDSDSKAARRLRSLTRMNGLLRAFFVGLAFVSAIGAALLIYDLRSSNSPVLPAKTWWTTLVAAVFFAVAAWRFSPGTKFKYFLILLALFAVESLLQIAGWIGLLPAVNTKERLPWGRVYWTGEGHGNSIRNRYGWHFPEFDLTKTNRLAIIGDSFVEAVEVHRTEHLGGLLRESFRSSHPQTAVLALGNHGTGPAHYLEILRYAQRHFAIQEAVFVIYLGNDITDCSSDLQFHDAAQFIYYTMAPSGVAVLKPAGEKVRAAYARRLDDMHRPPWIFLPRILSSHSMSVQMPLSVRNNRALRRRLEQDAGQRPPMEAPLAQLGLRAAPFAVEPSPEAREGMTILKSLLDQANAFSREHQIQLRLVTVPSLPPDFYKQTGTAWSARIGNYDFLAPDRELEGWAAQRGIPFLSLGQQMRAQGLTVQDIQALYFTRGSGHFSETGHRFAASAMQAAFFQQANLAK